MSRERLTRGEIDKWAAAIGLVKILVAREIIRSFNPNEPESPVSEGLLADDLARFLRMLSRMEAENEQSKRG